MDDGGSAVGVFEVAPPARAARRSRAAGPCSVGRHEDEPGPAAGRTAARRPPAPTSSCAVCSATAAISSGVVASTSARFACRSARSRITVRSFCLTRPSTRDDHEQEDRDRGPDDHDQVVVAAPEPPATSSIDRRDERRDREQAEALPGQPRLAIRRRLANVRIAGCKRRRTPQEVVEPASRCRSSNWCSIRPVEQREAIRRVGRQDRADGRGRAGRRSRGGCLRRTRGARPPRARGRRRADRRSRLPSRAA